SPVSKARKLHSTTRQTLYPADTNGRLYPADPFPAAKEHKDHKEVNVSALRSLRSFAAKDLPRKTSRFNGGALRVLAAIDQGVEGFLEEALQISAAQVAVQLQAEALGYL
ncbi:MAG TPA: hypothetical protein PKW83_10765, partial [Verrucomicrobiota bacterium]|nr:hypothetical protein [Verrucomicrobiota bacterium]